MSTGKLMEKLADCKRQLTAEREHGASLQRQVDETRALNEKLSKALIGIALTPDEDNEWDGRDKFRAVREDAMKALNWTTVQTDDIGETA